MPAALSTTSPRAPSNPACKGAEYIESSVHAWQSGRLDRSLTLAETATGSGRHGCQYRCKREAYIWYATLLTRVRHLTSAERMLVHVEPPPAGPGDEADAALVLRHAEIALAKGSLEAATELAAAGVRLAEQAGDDADVPAGHIVMAISATRRMDATVAVQAVTHLRDAALVGGVPRMRGQAIWAVAQSVEARDGVAGAAHLLRGLVDDDHLVRELLSAQPAAASWLVRAARRLDDERMARQIVRHACDLAKRNDRFPTVQASAAHAVGLVDLDERALATACKLHVDQWSKASALEDLGVLRSTRHADRERVTATFKQAADLFLGVEAARDASRAHSRLRELGGHEGRSPRNRSRPKTRIDQLTSTEFAVAELVRQGLTNKRVAQQLFMSPHTVAFHLKKIFRKLAISSRVELASSWNQLVAPALPLPDASVH